jgi:hypothetical protein
MYPERHRRVGLEPTAGVSTEPRAVQLEYLTFTPETPWASPGDGR